MGIEYWFALKDGELHHFNMFDDVTMIQIDFKELGLPPQLPS